MAEPKDKKVFNRFYHDAVKKQDEILNPVTPDGERKDIVVGGSTNPTLETKKRIIDVAKMISEGKSRRSCIKHLKEWYGIGDAAAAGYYNDALKWLIPDDLDAYQKGLVQANADRLETIIEEAIAKKDDARRGADYLRAAKDAIAELNKMMGIGGTKVQVAQEDDKGKKQTIQIKFE